MKNKELEKLFKQDKEQEPEHKKVYKTTLKLKRDKAASDTYKYNKFKVKTRIGTGKIVSGPNIRIPKWKVRVQTHALLTKKFFQQYRKNLSKNSVIKMGNLIKQASKQGFQKTANYMEYSLKYKKASTRANLQEQAYLKDRAEYTFYEQKRFIERGNKIKFEEKDYYHDSFSNQVADLVDMYYGDDEEVQQMLEDGDIEGIKRIMELDGYIKPLKQGKEFGYLNQEGEIISPPE